MQGRAFLDLARSVSRGGAEVFWRGAAIHAYYGLLLECRDTLTRWGFPAAPRQAVHAQVRIRFTRATDPDLKSIGDTLDTLSRRRNEVNYDLTPSPRFASSILARTLIQQAADAPALLDAIEADPVRRAVAVASLPPWRPALESRGEHPIMMTGGLSEGCSPC